jgi:hypothetical protein
MSEGSKGDNLAPRLGGKRGLFGMEPALGGSKGKDFRFMAKDQVPEIQAIEGLGPPLPEFTAIVSMYEPKSYFKQEVTLEDVATKPKWSGVNSFDFGYILPNGLNRFVFAVEKERDTLRATLTEGSMRSESPKQLLAIVYALKIFAHHTAKNMEIRWPGEVDQPELVGISSFLADTFPKIEQASWIQEESDRVMRFPEQNLRQYSIRSLKGLTPETMREP